MIYYARHGMGTRYNPKTNKAGQHSVYNIMYL